MALVSEQFVHASKHPLGNHRIPDAWTRAKDRFIGDLSEDEKKLYHQATPEAILYEVSAIDKRHQDGSRSRKVLEKMQGFVNGVEQYGKALDVYANTYPLVMSPLWGSFRVILIVRGLVAQSLHFVDAHSSPERVGATSSV